LDICRNGEDQIHEFKAAGTDVQKLTKECAALANTKLGGLIFYGVEDDGTIAGTDKRRQQLDQPIQNSIRNAISPALIIDLVEKEVLGHKIILLRIPAWNRKDVYQYMGKVLLRIGTNVFVAKPEQTKKLHKGIPII
jgi:predicted HTH transcriptional regulator